MVLGWTNTIFLCSTDSCLFLSHCQCNYCALLTSMKSNTIKNFKSKSNLAMAGKSSACLLLFGLASLCVCKSMTDQQKVRSMLLFMSLLCCAMSVKKHIVFLFCPLCLNGINYINKMLLSYKHLNGRDKLEF